MGNLLSEATGVPKLLDLAKELRAKGKTVNTVEDLIRCYYDSFTVVRIPVKGRPGRLAAQVETLHQTIQNRSQESFHNKIIKHMLSNSNRLNRYINMAFEHFSEKADEPFNFVAAGLKYNPIPQDFEDHILQLALATKARNPQRDGIWIFERLSDLLASCVLLDCRKRTGKL